jgi:hypothetical protein
MTFNFDETATRAGQTERTFEWWFVSHTRAIQFIGCPTSGVAHHAIREAATHARGVSKARQGNSKKVGGSQNPINCSEPFPCPLVREK